MATSHSFTQLWARNIDSRVGRDGAIPNLSFPYFRLYFLLRSSHSLYLLLCVYRRNLTHVSCPGSREPRKSRDPVVNPRTLRGTPCAACGLVAGGDLDLPVALLALDEAAPVELALAALHSLLSPRLVPPVAAHQLAPVDPRTPLQQERKTCSVHSGIL